MNKITYKKVSHQKIDDNFLNGYIRFQETKDVVYVDNGVLKQKYYPFMEDWNQEKLITVSRELKEEVKKGGSLFAAYDKDQIVGFTLLQHKIYLNKYINLEYLHTSKGYRGYGIGKYLFYLVLTETKKYPVDTLYITTHPNVDTQGFYKSLGCTLATEYIPELYENEPYDIHVHYLLNPVEDTLSLIESEFNSHKKVGASTIAKIASKLYRYLPKDEKTFLDICKRLIISDRRRDYSLSTSFLKKRTDVIKEENMRFFEDILLHHIHGWGQVDQYCYRVMNPMIELRDEYYEYLLKWSDSDNKDVRRASIVAMIRSDKGLKTYYDFDKMIYLVEKLKTDPDYHVKKAVGWVLKCSYFKYPERLEKYLRDNVDNLDRLIFRYALEHIKDPLREELMSL